MSPEEILLQAQKAAKDAADRLTLKRPNSKVIFPKSDLKLSSLNFKQRATKVAKFHVKQLTFMYPFL